jgi:4-aminobutyrate aminotransferase-like enzyme
MLVSRTIARYPRGMTLLATDPAPAVAAPVHEAAAVRAPGTVPASQVHEVLGRSLLVDGFEMVLDLEASRGSRLVDARDGSSYLDLFTFFASSALGMNHPRWLPTRSSARSCSRRP